MATNIQPTPEYWNDNFLEERNFAVPIGSSNEVVEINLNDLPETEEILDVLKGERPPIRTWNKIALHYLVRKKEDAFCAILENARLFANKDHKDKDVDEAFCMDLLANFYALESSKERERERKKELTTKATLLYNQVDKLLVYNQYHLVGRAYFCLFDTEKIEQALTQFDFVLRAAPTDPLALQGRGIVAFHKQDFKAALACFKKLLLHHPGCAADVRMAIGHCLFKLGRYEKAKIAYERTLQLEPDCVGAMVGLALTLLNEGTAQSIKDAMKLIVNVYSIDKTNPINLNLLADHFFYRKEPEKAINLSSVAIQTAYSDMLKAESAYMLGRSFHYKEDYDQAFQYYYQATQFAKPLFVLPWYGLGQMYIQRGEYSNATSCFEKVLAQSPNNIETLRILGLMYLSIGASDKKEKAKAYLKKVTELCPDDIDAHMKFAELHEVSDPRLALQTYLRVLTIYRDREAKGEIPPELYNNISVLYFHLGEYENSQKYLMSAKNRAGDDKDHHPDGHSATSLVTMTYNQGRLAEEMRDFEEAQKCYKSILMKYTNYIDCYLRYGCLARDRGNIAEASDWFKEAANVNPTHPDPHLLLGNLHMSKAEYAPAQKKYEKVLENSKTKSDTYAKLSMGNIWLETLYTTYDMEKRKRHSDRAFEFFKKVLESDPSNVYAVNGMGAILAKSGAMEEAKEMFAVVRESTADILDLWLNIGHQYCEQKQYVAGMKMYENALKRFKDASLDPQVHLYLARAQYFNGDYRECRRTLQLARHFSPHHQLLRYNLGVVMKRMAVTTLKDSRANLQDVMGAIEDLKGAQIIFDFLAVEGEKASVDQARAAKEAQMCSDLLNQTTYHLERAKETDHAQQIQRQKIEEAKQAYVRRVQEEMTIKQEVKIKEQEELMRKRQEAIQRTMEVKEKIIKQAAEDAEYKPVKKRQRKQQGLGDEFIDDENYGPREGVPEGEPRQKKRKYDADGRPRKSKTARRKRREQQRLEGGVASSDEDEPRKPLDPYGGPGGKRYLTKAYVSDSDSSSSSSSDEGTVKKADAGGSKSSGDEDGAEKGAPGGGAAALASSDEETGKAKKKTARAVDSDEEENGTQEAAGEGSSNPTGTKRALASSDEDEGAGLAGLAEPEDDKAPESEDESPRRAKLSLNDSGSE